MMKIKKIGPWIQYILEEQEVLRVLDHIIIELEKDTTPKYISDSAAFELWKKKNFIARITLLSGMKNNVAREFREYEVAKKMWCFEVKIRWNFCYQTETTHH
jgi:hypothetical protein